MDEDLLDFLLLLELPFLLRLSTERLSPGLGALGVPSGHLDYALDLLYLLAHRCVQLDLHRVQVEVNILPETDQERQRLLDAALFGEVVACSQL
jgi:hypothetical protein